MQVPRYTGNAADLYAIDDAGKLVKRYAQLQTYKNELPTLFTCNEAMVVSDGIDARIGTHLNLRAPTNGNAVYDVTRPNAAQREILDTLGAGILSNDEDLRPKLTPRLVAA